jgi:hypothetical protein
MPVAEIHSTFVINLSSDDGVSIGTYRHNTSSKWNIETEMEFDHPISK